MKSLRSSFGLLLATFGAALLFANCKVTSVESDESCTPNETHHCTCTNGDDGSQTCNSKGTAYGACKCDSTSGGGSANNGNGGEGNTATEGGKSGSSTGGMSTGGKTTGGTSTGGSTSADAGAGMGGAGDGGAPPEDIDPTDCAACLAKLCPTQWQECVDEPNCLSKELDGSGQYERIQNGCIEPERVNGVVKRDVVRGCGVSIGKNTDPDYLTAWAPEEMDPKTTALMNCMAMGATNPDASWANDPDNFPVVNDMVQPVPWPDGTCAKLACTSKVQ